VPGHFRFDGLDGLLPAREAGLTLQWISARDGMSANIDGSKFGAAQE
jgi:hypothetical protein